MQTNFAASLLIVAVVAIQFASFTKAGDTALHVEHGDGHVDHRNSQGHGEEHTHTLHHGHAKSVGHIHHGLVHNAPSDSDHVGDYDQSFSDQASGDHEHHYKGPHRAHSFH